MNRVAVFRSSMLQVSETFVRDQLRALRDWQAVLVGFRHVPGGLSLDGVPCRLLPDGGSIMFRLRAMLDLPVPELVSALTQLRVSLIHVHFGLDAVDIWPSVRTTGLPMLVTLHGYDIHTRREWWEAGKGGVFRRSYPRRLLQMAREPSVRFIAVSSALRQSAIEFGIPPERIAVSYIGVDTERFKPDGLPIAQRRPRILFVGRMVEKKAPLLMIRAFSIVREKVGGAELVMIGDGRLLNKARQLANDLQVPVQFLGARTPQEVIEQLHQARVFCLPSVTARSGDAEGFGLVLLEAQACGVPVVTSARGGASEGLLPDRTGHAIPEGDVAQLAVRLIQWLTSDVQAEAASTAASRFARDEFDIRRCATQLERIYESSTSPGDRH